jgi:hypothetical protein
MKTLLLFSLSVLLSGCQSVSPVVENKSSAAVASPSSAETSLMGEYAGKWASTEGTGGELRLKLNRSSATPRAEAMFTYQGTEIPGTVKTVETNGSKVRIVFDWSIQGTAGQSTLVGEATGATVQGTYETRGVAGSSRGTWSVTRG